MNNKIEALRKYLGINEEVEIVEGYDTNIFEVEGSEYLVLTNEEANEKTQEYILETLWAFNADFILKNSVVINWNNDTKKALTEMQSKLCEGSNEIIKAIIKDMDQFVEKAIDADGRGHFLSTYDGNENEEEVNGVTYYIYQTN